jgi:hypothetical protein
MAWEQLLSIMQEQRQLDEDWRDSPPVACPNDGAVLQQQGPDGDLNCPMGDYRYPRDGHPADRRAPT